MNSRITIQQISQDENISELYSDEDIVIIDNVKNLVDPQPARMNMNMLVICTQGRAEGDLNGRRLSICKNQLTIFPPNVTVSNFMVSPDFDFKAMFFTTRILQSFLGEKMSIWNEVMYIHHLHVLTVEDRDLSYYRNFYDMLRLCIDMDGQTPFRIEIIQALLRAAFLALCGRMKSEKGEDISTVARGQAGDNLFQRFLSLLNSLDVKRRTIEEYANRLCVSPKYLSMVCKKTSGKTAGEWITEHVMEDIRYQLCNTDHTIKQICSLLGFSSPSFFGKYVREHFGMTPVQLRYS
ncbi:MAG: helix-turn-helix domain-containing protein [Prevotella sp.]|nr:helix-turn-helix domain-containing protein [Prevotella sp.]